MFWQSKMRLPPEFGRNDLVVFSSNPRILSNLLLIWDAKRRGCQLVSWSHYMSATSGRLSSWIRKKFTSMVANSYIVYTVAEAERMIKDGYSASTVWPVNNTIDTQKVVSACSKYFEGAKSKNPLDDIVSPFRFARTQSKQLLEFKKQHELASSTLLFCGRLIAKSKAHLLLEAIASITRSRDDITLVVIGDGPEREKLQDLATELNVERNVRWVGAVYEESELAPWFLSSKLFVFPGSIGLSLNHAMAYGLPVVAHQNQKNHGPEFSYLEESVNGFTFKEGSSKSLASTISNALNDERLLDISNNGLKKLHSQLTIPQMSNRFARALRSTEGKKRS
jgi:glycosyltransferase involved in cell wall biosynthesis